MQQNIILDEYLVDSLRENIAKMEILMHKAYSSRSLSTIFNNIYDFFFLDI
jgi:hypothetical protein